MPAIALLLLPIVAMFALFAGQAVQASLNSGNEIMTASNYTFQSDSFTAAGAIGSVAGDQSDPMIITGRWNLDLVEGAVAGFSTELVMVNASGTGYRAVKMSNLSSTEVTVDENGTAVVKGVLDVAVDGAQKLRGVNATISLAKLRAFNMTLSEPAYLGEPIYGTADQEKETTTASAGLLPEGSGIFGNITEKFRLPQLPNPFR